jgi:phage tail sheath protein FI
MPEYLSPAVYLEEVESGIPPIEGVSTSTAGFVGLTRRGPVSGPPVLVTSFPEFTRLFGGYFSTPAASNSLPHAVNGFFANGGKRLFIVRVENGATLASTNARQGVATRLGANAAAAQTVIRLASLRNIDTGTKLDFVQVKGSVTTSSLNHTVTAYNRLTNEVTLALGLGSPFEEKFTTVTANGAVRANTLNITARDPGAWGRDIEVQAEHTTGATTSVVTVVAAPSLDVQVTSSAGFYVGACVEFDRGLTKLYRRVVTITGNILTVDGAPIATLAPDAGAVTTASVCEFSLQVLFDGQVEEYRGLSLDPTLADRYYRDQINRRSTLISVGAPLLASALPISFPTGDDGLRIRLGTGGLDSAALTSADVIGVDGGPGARTGIFALQDIEDISIVAVPGQTARIVQQSLIDHCELMRYRVAVLDPDPAANTVQTIRNQRRQYDTKYAALYFPRVTVFDPVSKQVIPAPPSGHVAGVYARVDETRGVYKPPANETLRAVDSVELIINKAEHDLLNPQPDNINVIRDFRPRGRGIRIYGARCITSESSWKYLNVRRLFIFLEASLERGTQWVVFEPNDERLWARVKQSIRQFLLGVWRDGALMGVSEEEAFFVKCDRTTMTQDDIDNGRLIIQVGVAPVKPAEFVIIRIGQKTFVAE